MKFMRGVVMVASMVCAMACAPGSSSIPPPPEATASCVYTRSPDTAVAQLGGMSTSTVWLNRVSQVIRVDGYAWENRQFVPSPYYFDYDEEGRLLEVRASDYKIHYTYTPSQVMTTSKFGDWLYDLVDGQVARVEGPEQLPPEQRLTIDYAYDDAGRIASRSRTSLEYSQAEQRDVQVHVQVDYTYDLQGRVRTLQERRDTTTRMYSFAYYEIPTQLVIDIDVHAQDGEIEYSHQRWTYDFDASHRITRIEHDNGFNVRTDTYSYEPGEIVAVSSSPVVSITRATGSCEPPIVVDGPKAPLPFRWSAASLSLPNMAPIEFGDL
jgi:hypothetical protein